MNLSIDKALALLYYGSTLVSSVVAMYYLIRERIEINKELTRK